MLTVNWFRSLADNEEIRSFVPFPKSAVTFAGGSKWVLYWNIVAWTMFGGKRFLVDDKKKQNKSAKTSEKFNM